MRFNDRLYKETLVRVGHEEMIGVDRLIENGHYGIAEKHGVHKLMVYIQNLEKKLGINVPDVSRIEITASEPSRFLKIKEGGTVHYQLR